MRRTIALALLGAVAALSAHAQTVTLNGHLGARQALLVIDGEPVAVAVGATVRGVRLNALTDRNADVSIGEVRRTLTIGAGPVRMGNAARGGGSEIVLTAGTGGHFRTMGQINGKSIEFMVDTGASAVVIGQADADRLGLDYKNGRRGMAETANGRAPFNYVVLNAVRIGDVEVANVEAAVIPAQMGHVLLGNTFLTRFQMKRENDIMRLEKRPN